MIFEVECTHLCFCWICIQGVQFVVGRERIQRGIQSFLDLLEVVRLCGNAQVIRIYKSSGVVKFWLVIGVNVEECWGQD